MSDSESDDLSESGTSHEDRLPQVDGQVGEDPPVRRRRGRPRRIHQEETETSQQAPENTSDKNEQEATQDEGSPQEATDENSPKRTHNEASQEPAQDRTPELSPNDTSKLLKKRGQPKKIILGKLDNSKADEMDDSISHNEKYDSTSCNEKDDSTSWNEKDVSTSFIKMNDSTSCNEQV